MTHVITFKLMYNMTTVSDNECSKCTIARKARVTTKPPHSGTQLVQNLIFRTHGEGTTQAVIDMPKSVRTPCVDLANVLVNGSIGITARTSDGYISVGILLKCEHDSVMFVGPTEGIRVATDNRNILYCLVRVEDDKRFAREDIHNDSGMESKNRKYGAVRSRDNNIDLLVALLEINDLQDKWPMTVTSLLIVV